MSGRVQLVIDPISREKVDIDLPIRFRVAPEEMRRHLSLPPHIDLSDATVAKAVGLVFAARSMDPLLPIAFFGGVATRFLCPTSNEGPLGLRRPLHDLDIACLHRQLKPVRQFLMELGDRDGSALKIFETPGDRIFNSLGEGRRFRFHDLAAEEDRQVDLGTIDLVADEFRFCHRMDLRADIENAPRATWTLSPALLLLAKLQFIQRVPMADAPKVQDRVLAPFGRHEVVIGPERKDVQDILALLVDLPFGETTASISLSRIAEILSADWGFWRTVGLNLSMVDRSPLLAALPAPFQDPIREKIRQLQERVGALEPKRWFAFLSAQWWQDVDSPPVPEAPVRLPGAPTRP
jgi:hypothetical protein